MKDNDISKEYRIAATEILILLEKLEENLVKKVPIKLIEKWKEIQDEEHRLQCYFSENIEEWKLEDKTKALLAMLYRNYWCNEEEKREYDKILTQNEEKYQQELREKYNIENIFKDKNRNEEMKQENTNLPIVQTNEKLYKKILDFIKKFFRRK